jgi:transcriptional regulator GlxA family with amidase domain
VPLPRVRSDGKVREAEALLQENFDSDISIEIVAKRARMSSRNFIRRFKAATGRLSGAYIWMLCVSAAMEMLEDGALVRCGVLATILLDHLIGAC